VRTVTASEQSGPHASNGDDESGDEDSASGSARYRTQKRGGKGVRDIRTSTRNGKVISIARVTDEDEVFLMTAKGKIQRISAADINVIGRNTQGVRIMNVDDGDSLIAVVRIPAEETSEDEADQVVEGSVAPAADEADTDDQPESPPETA
jgi:DNA gyrase subunit A